MSTKSLIQKKLADLHPNILRKDINICISEILNSIIDTVKDDSRAEFRGFGVFFSKTLKTKVGRNPKTGQTLLLKSRRRIRFKPSKILLKRLNKNFTDNNKISATSKN